MTETRPLPQRDFKTEDLLKKRIAKEKFVRLRLLNPLCLVTVGSTQDYVRSLPSHHEGDFVLSKEQTQGKGRQGRIWFSDVGGLWLSIVLQPDRPEVLEEIAITGAQSVLQTLQETLSLRGCSIKLPNDIIVNGRKIAGVLVDAEITQAQAVAYMGVGVNLNNDPTRNTEIVTIATSYFDETGKTVEVAEFAVLFLKTFDRNYEKICTGATKRSRASN
ncbi:MAG TPA: biotin--[acetyl-CoA-carboxylase] ligase [Nitrososphaerales archaeon]|nr:biotin--[acetyl-CoA-carboxylase] ligase [Nitrososphaerales archaeon]